MHLLLWLAACSAPDAQLLADAAPPPAAPVRRWDLTPVRGSWQLLMSPSGPLLPASDDRCVDCGLVRAVLDGAQLAFDPLPAPPRRTTALIGQLWGTFGATGLVQVWADGVDVVDPDTGALLWHLDAALPLGRVALVDADGDGVDELLTDAAGTATLWDTAGAVVRTISASDLRPCELDGDAGAEVVAADGGLWDLGTGARLGAVAQPVQGKNLPADLDGDGLDEFVVFDRAAVRAIDRSGVIRWQRADPSAYPGSSDRRLVVDASSGVRELWLPSSPALVRLDASTGAELGAPRVPLAAQRPSDPYADRPDAIRAWDSDGDGVPGVLFAQGSALVLDEGGVSRHVTVGSPWRQIAAADLDGDGAIELVLSTSFSYGATWQTFAPSSGALGPLTAVPSWDWYFGNVTPIDLDGDGHDALITGDVMWDASVPGAPVELSRGHFGTWRAVDLDGDGADEAVVSQMHGWGTTFSNGWGLGEAMAVQDVFDLDGDGVLEVVVGAYYTGEVEVRDATDGHVIDVIQVGYGGGGVGSLRGWRSAGGARLIGVDSSADTLRQWRLVRGRLAEGAPLQNVPHGSSVTAVAGGFAWVSLPTGETILVDHHLRVRQRVPVSLASIRVFDGRGWGLNGGEVWEVPLP